SRDWSSDVCSSDLLIFAREGADVALVYLPGEQPDAEQTRKDIEACGRRALLVPGDVQDSEFCHEAVERTVEAFGRLDVLVNNAAFQKHRKSLEEISPEQWEQTFRTNIFGYYHVTRFALRHMQPGASIINT